ncbi:MAG: hypothetical protein BJ554DRAFT_3538 [Olpidium bornovanus]|uniref:RRM domain-containing protein n=1 Tax=Olpidium bornovanus TaxID=278681 RepID=A0A8H7ZPG1_9FUNG|nr:MAG: hypothetical protein BJ554DRAFT_3538 [Olpidium bornovanus]
MVGGGGSNSRFTSPGDGSDLGGCTSAEALVKSGMAVRYAAKSIAYLWWFTSQQGLEIRLCELRGNALDETYGGSVGHDGGAGVPLKDGLEGTSSYGSYDQRRSAHGYGQEGGKADAATGVAPRVLLPPLLAVRVWPAPLDLQSTEVSFSWVMRLDPHCVADTKPSLFGCESCQNLNFARRINAAPSGEYRGASAAGVSLTRSTGGGYGGSYDSSSYAAPSSTNAAPYNYNAAPAANAAANYSTGTSHSPGQAVAGYRSGAGPRYGNAGSSYAEVNSYYGEGDEQAQGGGRGGPPYGGGAQDLSSAAYDDAPKGADPIWPLALAPDPRGEGKVASQHIRGLTGPAPGFMPPSFGAPLLPRTIAEDDAGEKSADTIYVENLSHDVTVDDIVQFFGSIGVIKLDKKNNNKPKGGSYIMEPLILLV